MPRRRLYGAMKDRIQHNQNTPFLSLPAELRNEIYELCATDTETISFRLDGLLYLPALSLVCHQIREEFREIYMSEAPKYATTAVVHLTNFVHKTAVRDIANTYAALPPSLHDPSDRKFILRFFVTNTFDRYLHHFRSLRFPPTASDGVQWPVEIRFEPKTFDVHYCRQLFPKVRWALSGTDREMCKKWRETEGAFKDAFRRYRQIEARLLSERKRERCLPDSCLDIVKRSKTLRT